MNKLVLSALAASVAIGTTNASEGDWAGLDAELNTLTSSLDSHGGPSVSGYLEATYDTVGIHEVIGVDAVADDPLTPEDETVVGVDAVAESSTFGTARHNLTVSGSSGGYGYHVDLDGGSEAADAYLTFTMGDMGWTMGTFMKPGTGADAEAENDRVFSTRNFGDSGDRSSGIMTSGSMDAIGYQIFVGDDETLAARVTYDVMTGDGINLSVAYSMDDEDDSNAMEANLSSGPFGLHYTMLADGDDDDTCITASYAVNDTWAVALRQTTYDGGLAEDVEDSDWAITYGDGGARWTIETLEGDDLTIGCIVSF